MTLVNKISHGLDYCGFTKEACGLEIVKENSKSDLPHNNFYPLGVRTEHGQYSSVRVANDHVCLRRKV